MAITPDNSNRIVAFTLHISRVYVSWYLVNLKDLAAIHLVDTACTSALYTELIRVN